MSIGIWQVVLILLIVVIIFGAGKLPNVMGDLAKGIRNFKAGMKEDSDEAATPEAPAVERRTGADPVVKNDGPAVKS
jgi:sec-independent protein translocase protein TatA